MSDDTPTQRFELDPPAAGERRKSRLPLVLGIAGGILLLVVILLLVLLFRRHGTPQAAGTTGPTDAATPAASSSSTPAPATPTPITTASPTVAPPLPKSTDATFTQFEVQKTINTCPGGTYYNGATPTVHVTWATMRAHSAWIVQGTSDAANSRFMQIPLKGNETNFPYSIDFACNSPSATYTITLVGNNGKHVSKSWTITNTSEGPAAPLPRP